MASSISVSGLSSASSLTVTGASSLGSVTATSLSQTDSGAPVCLAGPTVITNTLTVGQNATFNAISAQSITVQSDVVFSDVSTNNITFGGTLQQTSSGSVAFQGLLSASQLTASGLASLSSLSCSGSSAFNAPLSLSSSLLQTNSASINTIAGTTSFAALISASSGVAVSAPILVSASDGSFQVPNSISVAGHTVAWNRNVRGVASFVNVGSSSSPRGWEWISCSPLSGGGYQVDNSGACAMTLSPSGSITIPGTLTANALNTTAFNATGQTSTANLSVSNILLVSGASTFSQPLTLSTMINQTDSTKTSSFAGHISYSNSLTQSGNGQTTFSGGLVANSNLTVSGHLWQHLQYKGRLHWAALPHQHVHCLETCYRQAARQQSLLQPLSLFRHL